VPKVEKILKSVPELETLLENVPKVLMNVTIFHIRWEVLKSVHQS